MLKSLFSRFAVGSWGGRVALVAALLAVIFVSSALSFVSSAHAASMTPSASANGCTINFSCVRIWATHVNVRDTAPGNCAASPSTSCPVISSLAGGGEQVEAFCQQPGQTITASGFTSNWWTEVVGDDGNAGYASNVYIVGGVKISGVPDCNR